MTPSEIITADAQQHGVDPQKVLSFVAKHVQDKTGSIMSAGDSVLLIIHLGSDVVECHLYTQDKPQALRQSLAHFVDILRQSPVKRLYGQADNEGIIQMLRLIGLPVEKSDLPKYNWMANV